MADNVVEKAALYKKSYGGWGGNPKGRAPDFTRCCVEVARPIGRTHLFGQCQKPKGYGPDGAYCKIHDPAAVAARRKKQDDEYQAERNRRRYEWNGKRFFNALVQIAEGHNDPRSLAKEIIAEFERDA